MTNNLRNALIIRAISGAGEAPRLGAALAVTRHDVMIGVHADHPAGQDTHAVHARLMAITAADMPPGTDDVGILLETLAQRLGGLSHAAAWQSIGINPNRGRGLLSRSRDAVDWPIFFTLRHAALGG